MSRLSAVAARLSSIDLVDQLLGRDVVDPLAGGLGDYVEGVRAVVTGAGGSIGREVCRTLACLGARELILVEVAEAPLVDAVNMLRYEERFERAVPILADLRREKRAFDVFCSHPPDLIVHAAAYKHVPLAEMHVFEFVANNVVVTRRVLEAAVATGAGRVVALSTDKAVRPVSVLGMTKAVGEAIVRAWAPPAASYSSIRLGNVLGSTGSVVPLMLRQIEHGGPVTVTHPEATRYLVAPGEAARFAVAAGALGSDGDVLGLETGAPVRILDLARTMILRQAMSTGHHVPIEIVGLRKGERLHEPLWEPGDRVEATRHPRIVRVRRRGRDLDELAPALDRLEALLGGNDEAGIRRALRELSAAAAERHVRDAQAEAS